MTDTSKPGTDNFVVVVAYDGTVHSELALAEGLALADAQPRALVHVLAVLDSGSGAPALGITGDDADAAEQLQVKVRENVTSAVQKAKPSDFYFYVHARIGSVADTIVELAGEVEADVIVVGTHGRTGLKRVVLGSVAEAVTRHAQCPVLVMRDKTYDPADRPTIEPEPADPSAQPREKKFRATIPPERYAFTKKHQVMPMRPDDWPLW